MYTHNKVISNHKHATNRDLHDGHLAVLPKNVIHGCSTESVQIVRCRSVDLHQLFHFITKYSLPSL